VLIAVLLPLGCWLVHSPDEAVGTATTTSAGIPEAEVDALRIERDSARAALATLEARCEVERRRVASAREVDADREAAIIHALDSLSLAEVSLEAVPPMSLASKSALLASRGELEEALRRLVTAEGTLARRESTANVGAAADDVDRAVRAARRH